MFVQNNALWGVAHVAAVTKYLGWARVDGIEVGNEVLFRGVEGEPRSYS
jgi:exo-beta-1,3-glucanase (GH17 family)